MLTSHRPNIILGPRPGPHSMTSEYRLLPEPPIPGVGAPHEQASIAPVALRAASPPRGCSESSHSPNPGIVSLDSPVIHNMSPASQASRAPRDPRCLRVPVVLRQERRPRATPVMPRKGRGARSAALSSRRGAGTSERRSSMDGAKRASSRSLFPNRRQRHPPHEQA